MAQDFLEDHGKKFCILPWIHMATYTNGKSLLCCLAQPTDDDRLNLNNATIDAVWNSYYFKDARKDTEIKLFHIGKLFDMLVLPFIALPPFDLHCF